MTDSKWFLSMNWISWLTVPFLPVEISWIVIHIVNIAVVRKQAIQARSFIRFICTSVREKIPSTLLLSPLNDAIHIREADENRTKTINDQIYQRQFLDSKPTDAHNRKQYLVCVELMNGSRIIVSVRVYVFVQPFRIKTNEMKWFDCSNELQWNEHRKYCRITATVNKTKITSPILMAKNCSFAK